MLITFAFAFDSHLYTGTSQGLTFLHAPGYCTFANTDVFWGFNWKDAWKKDPNGQISSLHATEIYYRMVISLIT